MPGFIQAVARAPLCYYVQQQRSGVSAEQAESRSPEPTLFVGDEAVLRCAGATPRSWQPVGIDLFCQLLRARPHKLHLLTRACMCVSPERNLSGQQHKHGCQLLRQMLIEGACQTWKRS